MTLGMRVVLLPLAVKQIRSMQAMTAIQPKVKQIQQRYKGQRSTESRQKMNEEMMALYKQYGVNPLSGCLPLLAQFPVLIALYGVLRVPVGIPHVPADSSLRAAIETQHVSFLGTNLLCSAAQAGKSVQEKPVHVYGQTYGINGNKLDCGKGSASRIPYYAFALAMVATTYYQQRQMQRATPQGTQQQQALTKIMPLLFVFWGYLFPAGLVVYWTTTNVVQVLQQQFMLPKIRAAKAEEVADPKRGKGRGRQPDGQVRRLRDGTGTARPVPREGGSGQKGRGEGGRAGPRSVAGREDASTKPSGGKAGGPGPADGQRGGRPGSSGSSGGSGGGNRKKRRKR